jgi:hypothetical protein
MILRKLLNAGELFWESLDQEERAIVIYVGAYAAFSLLAVIGRRQAGRQRQFIEQAVAWELSKREERAHA